MMDLDCPWIKTGNYNKVATKATHPACRQQSVTNKANVHQGMHTSNNYWITVTARRHKERTVLHLEFSAKWIQPSASINLILQGILRPQATGTAAVLEGHLGHWAEQSQGRKAVQGSVCRCTKLSYICLLSPTHMHCEPSNLSWILILMLKKSTTNCTYITAHPSMVSLGTSKQ